MRSRHLAVLTDIERELRLRVSAAAAKFGGDASSVPTVSLGPTRGIAHGDFATPVALAAGKMWKRNPMEVAGAVAGRGVAGLPGVASLDVAAPGFLNLRMAPSFWSAIVAEALERGDAFGTSDALAAHGPLLVEFTSPNPTGPLVVVQGRSGSLGATLVAMFRFAGAQTNAETYVNDAGNQLDALADSLFARYATLCGVETPLPEEGYPGEYLIDVARLLRERDGDRWLNASIDERRRALGRFGRDVIVEGQRKDMERFGVHFDCWFSEASLHESGKVDDVLVQLEKSGYAYVKDGALYLKSSEFGDEKDRVLRR